MSQQAERQTAGNAFIDYLRKLADADDRAALASLRRGLGKPPGTAAETHRYVVPFTSGCSRWEEDCHYIVASLFAAHPSDCSPGEGETGGNNLGTSMARLAAKTDSESIEKRFTALLNCHRDDLHVHLRHAVGLLKTEDVPISYTQLLRDIRNWNHPARYVQRNWAKGFWAGREAAIETGTENI